MAETTRTSTAAAGSTTTLRLLGKDVFADRATALAVLRGRLNGDGPMHDHEFMEIQVVLSGRGIHRTLDEQQPVGAGDVFVLRPGTIHTYRECRNMEILVCCFGVNLLARELAWLREDPALSYLLWTGPRSLDQRGLIAMHLPPKELARLAELLKSLRRSLTKDRGFSRAAQLGWLLLVLNQLADTIRRDYRDVFHGSARIHVAVEQAAQWFEQNPASAWTLDDIARRLQLAKAYFVRLFKSQTGLSPMAFLHRTRAEHAARMLLQTQTPIGRIGQRVGWDDPAYFSRRFKAYYGVNPTQYRARICRA